MNTFLRVDINIIAAIQLLLVVCIAYRNLDRTDQLSRAFFITAYIIIAELLFETATCVVNKRPELWLIPISDVLHVCLFATAPLLTLFWVIFIRRWIGVKKELSKTLRILVFLPVAVNFVFAVLSPFYGLIFSVDAANVYHRGGFFYFSSAISNAYMLFGLFTVIVNKKKILKKDYLAMLVVGIMPIVGTVIQSLFYGVLLIWSSAAFTLVVVYDFLQQRMINVDRLTGAWTRGSFEQYMQRTANSGGKSGIIFADFDGLKKVNDKEGHMEGDIALRTAVGIIKNAIRKTDAVVRFGGDEFVILLGCATTECLRSAISRIESGFDRYNESSGKDYRISCSFGYDVFEGGSVDLDKFLHHVDDLMYENKKQKNARAETSAL